jgi:hypothetical protein
LSRGADFRNTKKEKRMKCKFLLGLAVALSSVAGLPAQTQTSNSVSVSAVTPPASPVISSLTGVSPSGKIYTGVKMPIIGTGFTSACVVNVDGTAQASSTFVFVSATEIDFTIPAALGSSGGTSHAVTVSCPNPALAMNVPVTLPNATGGASYSQDLKSFVVAGVTTSFSATGGTPPYKWTLAPSSSLPTGLGLSPSGVVNGTPSGAGSLPVGFSFNVSDANGVACQNNTGILSLARPVSVLQATNRSFGIRQLL